MKAVIHSAITSLAPGSSSSSPSVSSDLLQAGNTVPVQPANGFAQLTTSRRVTLALFLLPSLASSKSGAAFAWGISGPKEWLKEQMKKTSKYVLAPIEASHKTLEKAYQLLKSAGPGGQLTWKRFGACLILQQEIVYQISETQLSHFNLEQVCTFSLTLKNASSLLDDKDPVKLEAQASLNQLIRSFSDIGSLVETSNFELSSDRKLIEDGLTETISVLEKFEQGTKSCLGI